MKGVVIENYVQQTSKLHVKRMAGGVTGFCCARTAASRVIAQQHARCEIGAYTKCIVKLRNHTRIILTMIMTLLLEMMLSLPRILVNDDATQNDGSFMYHNSKPGYVTYVTYYCR